MTLGFEQPATLGQQQLGKQRVEPVAEPVTGEGLHVVAAERRLVELRTQLDQARNEVWQYGKHGEDPEPGRMVCLTCGVPVRPEPCQEHNPQVLAAKWAEMKLTACAICEGPLLEVQVEEDRGTTRHLVHVPSGTTIRQVGDVEHVADPVLIT